MTQYPCESCGFDTFSEFYQVHDRLWPGVDGFLCIGCLEAILDRQLEPDDFTLYPINWVDTQGRSPLLLSRLGSLNARMEKCRKTSPAIFAGIEADIGAKFMAAMIHRLRSL